MNTIGANEYVFRTEGAATSQPRAERSAALGKRRTQWFQAL
jgi:hypothetical protein